MTAVFLDLDGTIMDSRPGIVRSLRHAFEFSGQGHLIEDDLTWMIGPPFVESFAQLGVQDAEPILSAYREHYQSDGMFDAEVYPGIFEALEQLTHQGHRCYLMTAKPHAYATKITAHFGIAPYLTAEFGPELDGTRNWKGDLLAYALTLTGEDVGSSVMVGDRYHDMGAAAEVGMPSIAATWGYGSAEDWRGSAIQINEASELPAAVENIRL